MVSNVVRAMIPEADVKCDVGNFECNICFDLAQDPILTPCGHLYCWPCLYQWLQVHSHSHECPVCKALVQEEKLVPIYGRGKSSADPRSRLVPGVDIPHRPTGQRPQTAPPVDINYFRQDELDPRAGYSPMAAARFGNLTLSALFGAIPAFFNLQVHGFHDATVYGATTGVPHMFFSRLLCSWFQSFTSCIGNKVYVEDGALDSWFCTVHVANWLRGTFIDQGETPNYYFQKYPEENPILGFFTWRWVLTLGFDHMFSSPIFLGTLTLLGASLMACTYTTQIPLVKVARRWSFLQSAEAIRKQEYSDTLPRASIQDLGIILMGAGYEVFVKGPSLYAFKGLAGRFAPIGVHIALLLVMAGGTLSATGSFRGSVTVPQGLNFVVGDVLGPSGFLSTPLEEFNTEVHINKFSMEYYDSGEVSQFRSDISLFDLNGKEVMRKTISVNDPLRYEGITIYQTDWSISALQVMKNDEGPFNLAMAPLKINGDKKLYGTFLPLGDPDSAQVKGISMLARDLQSIVLYDEEGKFAGVRRPNSKLPIEVNGNKIVVVDAIGSTGLELKTDPGVPIVYAGFGALMLTTCISYLSHAQIWALQDGTSVFIGGKTNRAKGEFPDEMDRLLDQVPELVESSPSTLPVNNSG